MWAYWKESRAEHPTYEERLRESGLFILGKKRLRGIFIIYLNSLREGAKRTEPGSFCALWQDQRHGRHTRTQKTLKTSENSSLLWGWLSSGAGCPGLLWSLCPWRCSKAVSTWSWPKSGFTWARRLDQVWVSEVPSNLDRSVFMWKRVSGLCLTLKLNAPHPPKKNPQPKNQQTLR